MKLSKETLERHRQRVEERQEELQFNTPPMTLNRSKDFKTHDCKHCQVTCDYCLDPLGR
jgi:hypothetical protein